MNVTFAFILIKCTHICYVFKHCCLWGNRVSHPFSLGSKDYYFESKGKWQEEFKRKSVTRVLREGEVIGRGIKGDEITKKRRVRFMKRFGQRRVILTEFPSMLSTTNSQESFESYSKSIEKY